MAVVGVGHTDARDLAVTGALMLVPSRAVHTLGMRFPIDVAFCDGDMRVLRVVTMPRHRLSRPVWRARSPYSRQLIARQIPSVLSRMATLSPRSRTTWRKRVGSVS